MTDQSTPRKMKAIVRNRFGPPEVLETVELDRPVPADAEVLVRINAVSLNRADWYTVAGRPLVGRPMMGLRKPKSNRLGTDYAGVVEAVGKDVVGFGIGDEVFGGRDGALAEYVCARFDRSIVLKPANVTFEQAAAVPVAALTALQGLRDKGGLQPGQQVLIQGASGGVGTFAVQIAKALGGAVTAVCGPRGVAAAKAGGADHVIDYTVDDFTRRGRRYDLVLDIAGTRSWRRLRRVLTPRATVVLVGGPKKNRFLGPMGHVISKGLGAAFSRRRAAFFIAKFNKADMETLRDLLASGKIVPVIDRRFGFDEIAAAFSYMGDGHPQGKVVITM
jgi:NADPH:quinone reductase-like Zn-dependent oxidoreductase